MESEKGLEIDTLAEDQNRQIQQLKENILFRRVLSGNISGKYEEISSDFIKLFCFDWEDERILKAKINLLSKLTPSAYWFLINSIYFAYASNEFIDKKEPIKKILLKILDKFSNTNYSKNMNLQKDKNKRKQFLFDLFSFLDKDAVKKIEIEKEKENENDNENEISKEPKYYIEGISTSEKKQIYTDTLVEIMEENLKKISVKNQKNLTNNLLKNLNENNKTLGAGRILTDMTLERKRENQKDHLNAYDLKDFKDFKDNYQYEDNQDENYMLTLYRRFEKENKNKRLKDHKDSKEKSNLNSRDKDDILTDLRYKSKYSKEFEDYIIHKNEEINEKKKEIILSRSDEEKYNNPDDIVCLVCNDGDYEDNDLIVYCSKCQMTVHQNCYGITNIPDEDWLCYPCQAFEDEKCSKGIECVLCPIKGGAMKPSLLKTKSSSFNSIINIRKENPDYRNLFDSQKSNINNNSIVNSNNSNTNIANNFNLVGLGSFNSKDSIKNFSNLNLENNVNDIDDILSNKSQNKENIHLKLNGMNQNPTEILRENDNDNEIRFNTEIKKEYEMDIDDLNGNNINNDEKNEIKEYSIIQNQNTQKNLEENIREIPDINNNDNNENNIFEKENIESLKGVSLNDNYCNFSNCKNDIDANLKEKLISENNDNDDNNNSNENLDEDFSTKYLNEELNLKLNEKEYVGFKDCTDIPNSIRDQSDKGEKNSFLSPDGKEKEKEDNISANLKKRGRQRKNIFKKKEEKEKEKNKENKNNQKTQVINKKLFSENAWVHLSCALWLPDVHIEEFEKKENIKSIENIDKEKFRDECSICNLKGFGPTLKCGNLECQVRFHVECARINKYQMEMIDNTSGELKYYIYCRLHQPHKMIKNIELRRQNEVNDITTYHSLIKKSFDIMGIVDYKPKYFEKDSEYFLNKKRVKLGKDTKIEFSAKERKDLFNQIRNIVFDMSTNFMITFKKQKKKIDNKRNNISSLNAKVEKDDKDNNIDVNNEKENNIDDNEKENNMENNKENIYDNRNENENINDLKLIDIDDVNIEEKQISENNEDNNDKKEEFLGRSEILIEGDIKINNNNDNENIDKKLIEEEINYNPGTENNNKEINYESISKLSGNEMDLDSENKEENNINNEELKISLKDTNNNQEKESFNNEDENFGESSLIVKSISDSDSEEENDLDNQSNNNIVTADVNSINANNDINNKYNENKVANHEIKEEKETKFDNNNSITKYEMIAPRVNNSKKLSLIPITFKETLNPKIFPWFLIKVGNFKTIEIFNFYRKTIKDDNLFNKLILKNKHNSTENNNLFIEQLKKTKKIMNNNSFDINNPVNNNTNLQAKEENNNNNVNLNPENIEILDHTKYCYCKKETYPGEFMVGCEGENCPFEGWFHIECDEDLRKTSMAVIHNEKFKFFCKECRKKNKKSRSNKRK